MAPRSRKASDLSAHDTSGKDAPLLDVQKLAIRFAGASANVVDGVSFSINPGETLCIVGESGCGKSVTALSLMGLLPIPPAEIVDGRAMFKERDLLFLHRRKINEIRSDQMSMTFQEPMTSLNPAYRIGDQIAKIVLSHRKVSHAEARARTLEMLDRVRIPAAAKRLNDYPHQLSGGMRQRVMIAMALANDPALLIADEPTTALDVTIQAQILDLISTLQKETGTALMLITHDLGVVAQIANRVAVMYAGRIVEQSSVVQIFEDPQHPYTLGLMSSIPSLGERTGRLTTISGMFRPSIRCPPGVGSRLIARLPTRPARRRFPRLSKSNGDTRRPASRTVRNDLRGGGTMTDAVDHNTPYILEIRDVVRHFDAGGPLFGPRQVVRAIDGVTLGVKPAWARADAGNPPWPVFWSGCCNRRMAPCSIASAISATCRTTRCATCGAISSSCSRIRFPRSTRA